VNESELKQLLENHIRDQTQWREEQNKFSRELLEKQTRTETKLDSLLLTCPICQAELREQGKQIVAIDQSAKSAHHRIDGIFIFAGILGGLAGTLVNVFASLWSKTSGGGHG
jgi:hypothetical protein